MTTKATAEQVAIVLPHWYYVEWSPKGAIRAVPVEDAHFRNHCALKRREPVGYEPVGLCPSLDAALDFIIELKRMKKELWHDEAGVRGGNEGLGIGDQGDGAECDRLLQEGSGHGGPASGGQDETERLDQGDANIDRGDDEDEGVNYG